MRTNKQKPAAMWDHGGGVRSFLSAESFYFRNEQFFHCHVMVWWCKLLGVVV
jgi:hypothetical protein